MSAWAAPLGASQAEYELEVGPHPASDLPVLEFSSDEAMSAPYSAEVTVVPAEGVSVQPDDVLGKEATLTVHLGGGADRLLHGIVASVRSWREHAGGERIRFQLVPRLWILGQNRRSRIFQDLSAVEIVEEVLKEGGVDLRLELSGTYPVREYCVQYGESDLDFVSRLLAEEGIFFAFEHARDRHTMVLGDGRHAWKEPPGGSRLPFREPSRMIAAGEAIQAFAEQREVTPTAVTLRDYDWQRPALDLTCHADAGGGIEVYEYPGRYEDEAVGRRRTRVRLEELRVPAATGRGEATSRRLEPGHVLELAEHPLDALNRAYLLLEVRQRGRQPEVLGAHRGPRNPMERPDDERSHQATFACIPDDVPYRPRRARPRPVALGPQTAVVVGPASEEIHCDEHGRIKVQFHWDRQGARDERSSCWIRVSQAWAGPGWGALYLPRVGQEVVVEFLDGDLDRPLVTGAVYNGMNRPPLDLPQEKSRSTLRSATTPGGAGANELRFEDARDAEEVYLHAQRDLEVRVENDRSARVGRDERLTVGRDRARSVGGSQTLQVAQDDTSTIGGNQSITVGGNRTTTVAGAHAETIAGAEAISVGGARAVNVALASAETVGLAKVVAVGGAYTVTVGGLMSETVGAAKVEEVRGARTEQIGKDRRETVGGDRIVHVEGKLEETVDGARTLKVGKDLAVNVGGAFAQVARKGHTVKAKEIVLSAEETFTVKVGSAIIEVKKGGDVAIKGAKIELKASGDLVLKASKISEN